MTFAYNAPRAIVDLTRGQAVMGLIDLFMMCFSFVAAGLVMFLLIGSYLLALPALRDGKKTRERAKALGFDGDIWG